MIKRHIQKQVAVYEHKNPGPQPDCYLDSAQARQVIANGDACRINHGTAIRLMPGLKAIRTGSVECDRNYLDRWARPDRSIAEASGNSLRSEVQSCAG
jgi:hypothetical protein